MNRKTLEMMVDELVEAAAHRQSCEDTLNNSDGYHSHNMKAMELADRELLELRERLVTTLLGALNGSR
jgi:hypothetical protein